MVSFLNGREVWSWEYEFFILLDTKRKTYSRQTRAVRLSARELSQSHRCALTSSSAPQARESCHGASVQAPHQSGVCGGESGGNRRGSVLFVTPSTQRKRAGWERKGGERAGSVSSGCLRARGEPRRRAVCVDARFFMIHDQPKIYTLLVQIKLKYFADR